MGGMVVDAMERESLVGFAMGCLPRGSPSTLSGAHTGSVH